MSAFVATVRDYVADSTKRVLDDCSAEIACAIAARLAAVSRAMLHDLPLALPMAFTAAVSELEAATTDGHGPVVTATRLATALATANAALSPITVTVAVNELEAVTIDEHGSDVAATALATANTTLSLLVAVRTWKDACAATTAAATRCLASDALKSAPSSSVAVAAADTATLAELYLRTKRLLPETARLIIDQQLAELHELLDQRIAVFAGAAAGHLRNAVTQLSAATTDLTALATRAQDQNHPAFAAQERAFNAARSYSADWQKAVDGFALRFTSECRKRFA